MLTITLEDPQAMSSKTLALVAELIDSMALTRAAEEEKMRGLFTSECGENPFVEEEKLVPGPVQAFYPGNGSPVAQSFDEKLITQVPTGDEPPPATYGIERDSKGHPWDGRIHSSSRALVADGTWRMKRGVADELVQQVLAEFNQASAAPPPPSLFDKPPVEVPPPPQSPSAGATLVPPPPEVTTATTPTSPISFIEFTKLVTAAFASKKIDQTAINAAMQSVGIPSLPMLMNRPELIPQVAMLLGIAL